MMRLRKLTLAGGTLALAILLAVPPDAFSAEEWRPRPRPTPTPSATPKPTPRPKPGVVKVPHGIAALLQSDQSISESLFTYPGIDIVRMRTSWDTIQKNESSYDWSAIDAARSYAQANGRQLIISVVMCAGAPQFVYDAGAKVITLSSQDEANRMPLPWDPVMLEKETNFINAMAARLDGDPAVTAIVMGGLGIIMEGYIAKTSKEISQLDAAGGLPAYVTGAKKLIDVYAAAFKQTPFIYTAAKPYAQSGGREEMIEICEYGAATYSGRFGVMDAQLTPDSVATEGSPHGLVQQYHTTNPTGLQFLTNSSGFGGHDLGGTVRQTLQAGVALGPPNWIEVYFVDAKDPANVATFEQIEPQLTK
ncbi:hypothetical protein BH20VER3_BH20VER3_11490 [soil metagenome]